MTLGLMTTVRGEAEPGETGAVAGPGRAGETKLTVYLGRGERATRVPAYVAVCDLLRRRGIAGATALVGVDGTRHGQRQRAAFFGRNAGTPMMVVAVGERRADRRGAPGTERAARAGRC